MKNLICVWALLSALVMVVPAMAMWTEAPPPYSPFEGLRTDPGGGTGGDPINGFLSVLVIDADTGTPLTGAFVMAGNAEGDPFPGNTAVTNGDGLAAFSHPQLTGPITVTAGMTGYVYFSVVDVDADDLIIPLSHIPITPATCQVGDYVNGIDVNNGLFHAGDGWVDVAISTPTLSLEMILSFDISSLIGPNETMTILGNEVDVPSNIFIPQQWEIFVEINKNHYYLYLPTGGYTLEAISGRIGTSDLLSFLEGGGSMADIIPLMSWQEIDLLDITIMGATNNADFTVDPDLTDTVTMNLANVPEDTTAYGLSLGDLDDLHGTGDVVLLGVSALGCAAGTPCSGALQLSTTAATGEFAGMGYMAATAVLANTGNRTLAIVDRYSHNQTYTVDFYDFFSWLSLGYNDLNCTWNDVENTG
ncbi:hypothetical protein JW905_15070, partial [bacterium]|nr:hypothetical protein [candidate division CSSED10-310 bacterium]